MKNENRVLEIAMGAFEVFQQGHINRIRNRIREEQRALEEAAETDQNRHENPVIPRVEAE